MTKSIDLSIIIVSFNTSSLTQQCLRSVVTSLEKTPKITTQLIVVDNNSQDRSVEMLGEFKKSIISSKQILVDIIESNENQGFAKANNKGLKIAKGTYVLYLNSDTTVDNLNIEELIEYMESHNEVGVLTVRVNLANGSIDPACHRGFPTVWRSFTYFSKLEVMTKHIVGLNRLFGGYHLSHLNPNTEHEIDSPSGAFYLTRRSLVESLGGFDEAFFMYGEDLDLSMRIKKTGSKIVYYPRQTITHLKGQSGTKHEDKKPRIRTKIYFYDAMRIFYRKHYLHAYPPYITKMVFSILGNKIAKLREAELRV